MLPLTAGTEPVVLAGFLHVLVNQTGQTGKPFTNRCGSPFGLPHDSQSRRFVVPATRK